MKKQKIVSMRYKDYHQTVLCNQMTKLIQKVLSLIPSTIRGRRFDCEDDQLTPAEFRNLYGIIQSHVSAHWNVGRVKKPPLQSNGCVFVLVIIMTHPGSCDQLRNHFRIKGPTLMKQISGFMAKVVHFCVESFVHRYNKK